MEKIRFSILGFNQDRVRNYVVFDKKIVNGKEELLELRLDVTDLLILNHISDFPNRSNVKKILKGNNVFFWVYYNEILDELPVLRIKKQALVDRFDKMVKMHILLKEFVEVDKKNKRATFFSLTNLYEALLYENQDTPCSQLHTPPVVNYTPINNITTNNIEEKRENNKKERKDGMLLFDDCWKAYGRKGKKNKALEQWNKLHPEEQAMVLPHIKAYVSARERQYTQDFERYLRDKTFLSVVFKNNQVLYDPERSSSNEYRPSGYGIWFSSETQSYWTSEMYIENLFDGYEAEDRPDGAKLTLHNGRGSIVWSSETKTWVKQ